MADVSIVNWAASILSLVEALVFCLLVFEITKLCGFFSGKTCKKEPLLFAGFFGAIAAYAGYRIVAFGMTALALWKELFWPTLAALILLAASGILLFYSVRKISEAEKAHG
ncbi:MAG: hypothetical protein V1847_03150 [Candidatus Diapherotrites archaeon]